MKKIVFLLFTVGLLLGCSSDKITKEEAKSIIEQQYPQSCYTEHLSFEYDYIRKRRSSKATLLEPYADYLRKEGPITTSKKENTFLGTVKHTMVPTQRAKDLGYYDEDFIIAQTNFVDIIDISQTDKEATVRCKVSRTKTPFYILHELFYKNAKVKNYDCLEEEFEVDVTLIRFDDGWRVK